MNVDLTIMILLVKVADNFPPYLLDATNNLQLLGWYWAQEDNTSSKGNYHWTVSRAGQAAGTIRGTHLTVRSRESILPSYHTQHAPLYALLNNVTA